MKQVFALLCLISVLPVARKTGTMSPVDTNQLKQSGWYSAAMKNMAQSEYHIRQVENTNTYSSPNRRNNLRFTYDENGFSVEPRTTKIPIGLSDSTQRPEDIQYKTIPGWKVAFTLDKKQIGVGRWQVKGNQAEYITDNIRVQYINNEEGMRQNFILQRALSDDDNIQLHFSVQTKLDQRFSKDKLQFADKEGGVVLSYEQLKVWDANGKPLEAAFEKSNDDYSIHVNTQDASYPITIDPLSTYPDAMVESNQATAYLGYAVSSAGDVNGDGYSDIIAGAPNYDNGENDEGAFYLYHGSATGISITAAASAESNLASAKMGWSVSSAGDVNRDGYSDVIVGAPGYSNGESAEGAAFIYYGSAGGINTATPARRESNQVLAQFGCSVACAGDVNGDGWSDVIVGAPYYDNGQAEEGAAFVYYGSPIGIGITAVVRLESNQASANYGWSVASAGDVDGDRYSEVIVGAPRYDNGQTDEGVVFLHYSSASGSGVDNFDIVRLENNQAYAEMGRWVAGAGDVNGDGYSDVIIGAPWYDNGQTDEGVAFVYHGFSGGLNTGVAAMVESNQANAGMGYSVACAGDVNGDGYSDVIVGAPWYANGEYAEGTASIYQGSSSGISTTLAAMVESNQASTIFGSSVASAGDVNGDGYSDVVVGAAYYDNGQGDEGAAFTYYGAASGTSITAASQLENNVLGATMGWSVAGAGDVNGDGFSDVIVGARYYDGGQNNEGAFYVFPGSASGLNSSAAIRIESNQENAHLGYAVASAGDVNGDGYCDVVVGAPFYDNIEADEGVAFVYHGSPSGINSFAAVIVESNQAGANMGWSVASAGDVNGDGYSDVIVGAPLYNNGHAGEGAFYVYHGSASGISTNAATRVESNQTGAQFGWSVASAGDVNGNGYSDVIVGAPFYTNGQSTEGAFYIYNGSSSGISTTAAARAEANRTGANLGASVANAGDVNGDGYSDVIVGAPHSTFSFTSEGAAFVCYGSPSGITPTNLDFAYMAQGSQANAHFGRSVAGAGDVNGDGYSDVVVGATYYDNGETDEGAAFVYYGSASGVTFISTLLQSNQNNAYLGYSVAGAGDVNGDGYSDVIAGAPYYDNNGPADEGAALIYHGNSPGTSKRNNLTLYNANLTTPINRGNKGPGDFGAGLFAKSFLGRSKGKLVWETTFSYNAFSGSPIANSVVYTSQQSSYTDLGQTGTELKNLVAKQPSIFTKIRARVKYDPVTAITGQVYGPWRYVPAQIAGLSLGALPVDLISFNAKWLQPGKTALLQFVTDNESQVCCYNIEKSTDGVHFNTIGKVDAKNTAGRNTYSFTDNNATGKKLYYRLKINFTSGATEYSNIQMLQHNSATEIVVFPNPATNLLQLRLNNAYEKMNVQIMNSTGQVVKQYTNLSATNQVLQIPVSALASGTYFLYLQSGSEKQVLQFVKE